MLPQKILKSESVSEAFWQRFQRLSFDIVSIASVSYRASVQKSCLRSVVFEKGIWGVLPMEFLRIFVRLTVTCINTAQL